MIDLNDFSYKNANRVGNIQINSLSDEGFQTYLSKEAYPRSYLANRFPPLKSKLERRKANYNSSSMDVISKGNSFFSTQVPLVATRTTNINNKEMQANVNKMSQSKSHVFLYARETLNKDRDKDLLDYGKKLFGVDSKIQNLSSQSPKAEPFAPLRIQDPKLKKTVKFSIMNQTAVAPSKKLTSSNSEAIFRQGAKKTVIGFMSHQVPRITTQMKKSSSEILPKNAITKYYKTMEATVRTGEKQFGVVDMNKRERYNKLKGVCDNHNNKLKTLIQKYSVTNTNYLPKINSFSVKKLTPIKTYGSGGGKNMGEKYDPSQYFYPIHQMKERNEFGNPYLY